MAQKKTDIQNALTKFDSFLHSKGLTFNFVMIGGGALVVMSVISRLTRDVDCLDPLIPENIKKASIEFAKKYPSLSLEEDWLNNGPASLKNDLPSGWNLRLITIFKGEAMTIQTLGRSDFLKTKLYALSDRGIDLSDCLALKPSALEIEEAYEWVSKQDASELWPKQVRVTFDDLKKRLGYD